MNKLSRRSLARWAAEQLLAGQPAATVAKHLAAVLAQSGRAGQVDFLLGDINWELEQRQALAVGRVTSATPLSQQLEAALTEQLKKVTQADSVLLQKQIDPKVIGGLRLETASRIWDHTVSRKLSQLREVFNGQN
jgi:ATP synthase F1 delta subunit